MGTDWLYHCRTCGNTIEQDAVTLSREGSRGPVVINLSPKCGCGAGYMHCDLRDEVGDA